ncbi:transglycosylase domain-containing protein [Microbacterium halophytorum]|uniref:transglycosylase domain-containing protein n=1 Tax=Microbacterium halophytorum TaxID=2067568 RepID=UPI000CFB366A|nr:transglycosylase domain-containing protein [Microbacterium halophytorum]
MPHSKRTLGGALGGILGLVGLSAVAGLLVTATVTPAIALSSYTASGAMTMFENIPADLEVDQPMLPTTIYAKNDDGKNVELATFYDQNRIPLEYDELPQTIIDAVLSSEDPRFYDHGGVDLIGTSRALLSNAAGGATQGASTISQQFVKNVLVQRCEAGTSEDLPDDFAELDRKEQDAAINDCYQLQTDSEGTDGYQRKLQEMRYAIAIEKQYTKEEILLGYLNIANFGGQTYGIEAAAERYFGKSVDELHMGEAATLAGIVQNPNQLRLDMPEGTMEVGGEVVNTKESGYAKTEQRRNYVLGRMLEDGKITQAQHDKYSEATVKPHVTERNQGCQEAGDTAYFCEYVRQTILKDEAFGETANDRAQTLSRGGLEVYTTLNPRIQDAAEDSMNANTQASYDGENYGGAIVTLDPKTGDVLAMAQNTEYSQRPGHETGDGYTSLVYAAGSDRGNSGGFNVGSTYKLFTLVEWLQQGRSVNERIDGTDRDFVVPICTGEIDDNGKFTSRDEFLNEPYNPGNFNNQRGYVGTAMQYTAQSLNTGYMAMAEQLNVCDINETAATMGVTRGNGEAVTTQNVAPDVIGSKDISPIDIASAFATVANKGILCDQRAIRKVVGPDGAEMALPEHECKKVISPEVAATAAYALEGVMNGGTGAQGNTYDGTPLIGKTGTHEALQTWMVESSTNATTAAWFGNASGKGDIFGWGLQNIRYALARDTQAAANAELGGGSFPGPDDELTKVVMKDVPNIHGMSLDEAAKALEDAGFNSRVGDYTTGTAPEGTAERTDPSGSAPRGSLLVIRPSDGSGVAVPSVQGMSLSEARGTIQSAGLNASVGSCKKDEDLNDERATGSDPGAGATVAPGSSVSISYSAPSCGGDDDDDDDKKDKKSDKDDKKKSNNGIGGNDDDDD